jgi:hypothetical protein
MKPPLQAYLASLFFWLRRAFVGDPDFHFAPNLYPSTGSFMEWRAPPPGVAASPEAQTGGRLSPNEMERFVGNSARPAVIPLRAMPMSRAITG